jgi:hypothetical protein
MSRNDTRKSTVIQALGYGLSVTDASKKAGVTRKTVYRWLDDDGFKSEVVKAQNDVLERVGSRLSALALKGLNVMDELLDSEDESVRLRASSALLSRFTEILEVLRLEKRLEILEDIINTKTR